MPLRGTSMGKGKQGNGKGRGSTEYAGGGAAGIALVAMSSMDDNFQTLSAKVVGLERRVQELESQTRGRHAPDSVSASPVREDLCQLCQFNAA